MVRSCRPFCRSPRPLFPLLVAETWLIEAHQFRIITGRDPGKPTPEGLHRDGVDYVFISLIERHNISGGVTRVVPANTAARSHTVELARPANSLFLIDSRSHARGKPRARRGRWAPRPSRCACPDVFEIEFTAGNLAWRCLPDPTPLPSQGVARQRAIKRAPGNL